MTLDALRTRALLAACLYAAPWLAFAGTIEIEKAEGQLVVDLLDAEGRLHVDAMQAMLTAERPVLVSSGQTSFFKTVRGSMHGATLARIEYSYQQDGIRQTRIYHARSGRSMAVIAKVAERKIKSGTSSATESGETDTGGTDSGLTDRTQAPGDTNDAARDADERVYYPNDTATDVRVAALPDKETSIEAIDIGDEKSHVTDAEVKIVRRIDADIEKGLVKRGGEITGYVSKTVCESCTNAFNVLASRHDISGTVYQLTEPSPPSRGSRVPYVEPDPTTATGRSQLASVELKTKRKNYANAAIAKNKRGIPSKQWSDVSEIERAERNTASEFADACH